MTEVGEQMMTRTDNGHNGNNAQNKAAANTRKYSMALGIQNVTRTKQNIAMRASGKELGVFRVSNQFDLISLERFEPHWELQEDGTTIAQGKMDPVPVLPGQSIKMSLPLDDIRYKNTAHYEYVLCFRPVVNSLWGQAEQSVATGKLRVH